MSSNLVLEAVDELTDDEDDFWVLRALSSEGQMRFQEIVSWLRGYNLSEHRLRRSLNNLIEKGLVYKPRRGVYSAHMRTVMAKAVEILEKRERVAAEFSL